MSRLHLARPWLCLDLDRDMPVLSWAVNRPGAVTARRILWREVRNADLPVDLDVEAWLDRELEARHARDAVCFLTSCDIGTYVDRHATAGAVTARAVATVGLSNAECVGGRLPATGRDWGTINVAVELDTGLTEAARLETLSIAAQARTVAVVEAGLHLATGTATGTGTDCIAIAAPTGATRYAGLHTDAGEAVGRAVHEAVSLGARAWTGARRTPEPG